MPIKNIVFDVGNVLVRWDPKSVLRTTFPEQQNIDRLLTDIFRHRTWFDLNQGFISEEQALAEYHHRLNIPLTVLQQMVDNARHSLTPIPGSHELLYQLYEANYPLYALTDNTHNIMAYLKQTYDFWEVFKGIVVSAEVKFLKPSPEIYQYLLSTYQLVPEETVFIDDHSPNILGALACGIEAIQFENTEQCIAALQQLNIKV